MDEEVADVDATWVPYKERAEFDDVLPIYHNELESSIVAIAYSPKFKEVFAYLRALLAVDERSERAFTVTKDAVQLNPANYTLWQYRRNLLKTLKKDLEVELCFISNAIEDNPKNYQVWHHRKVLVEWIGDASRELAFTERILREDTKNYHGWQHRHWAVEHFGLWENELEYSNKLIAEDLRNNSAWNYRYFVISSTEGYTGVVLAREVELTLELIKKAPHNESAWNYLTGILMEKDSVASHSGVFDFCKGLYDNSCKSPYLLCFMSDYYTELGTKAKEAKEEGKAQSYFSEASKLLEELEDVDPIRKEYWKYLKSRLGCEKDTCITQD